MRVLTVNAGSSSLKLALIGDRREPLAAAEMDLGAEIDEVALEDALAGPLAGAQAIGHRVVHGGRRFTAPVRVDAAVRAALRELSDLAPLHQRKSLQALDAIDARLGHLPAVACFDTAFHARMPAAASTYALPARWREGLAIHRYGFHGLSHGWAARRSAELLGREPARLVSAHLGAGASLCAIAHGRSVDTTMGFTPLEGLAMATRSGSVDPGLVLWLLEHTGASTAEVAHALEHESGLLGLCGSADMREVLARADAGQAPAALALEVYLHRLAAGVASMAAALGGIDALAFTGGVGERSARIRSLAARRLAFLGVVLDVPANEAGAGDPNEAGAGDRRISRPESRVAALVLSAREDLEIASQTRQVLASAS